MSYDDETALRIVRAEVESGDCAYCHPLKRETLRALVDLCAQQQRELAALKNDRAARPETARG